MSTEKKSIPNISILSILVLLFPLIVLGGLWAKAATNQHLGQEVWQIKMTGYDPRDLLYGHYLRFRYDWNIAESDKANAPKYRTGQICMCLEQADEGTKNPIAIPMQCGAPELSSCQSFVKTHKYGTSYSLSKGDASEKYFIPEERAKQIDALFRKREIPFYMEVMAQKNGSVAVRGLYVDDMKLEDYLRQNPVEE